MVLNENRLSEVADNLRKLATTVAEKFAEAYDVQIVMARETLPFIQAMHGQGRQNLREVNRLRAIAALPKLQPNENVEVMPQGGDLHATQPKKLAKAIVLALIPKGTTEAAPFTTVAAWKATAEELATAGGIEWKGDKYPGHFHSKAQ